MWTEGFDYVSCFLTFQLSNDASCLIWTTSPENAKSLLKLSPESFVEAVNNAFVSFFDFSLSAQYLLLPTSYWTRLPICSILFMKHRMVWLSNWSCELHTGLISSKKGLLSEWLIWIWFLNLVLIFYPIIFYNELFAS